VFNPFFFQMVADDKGWNFHFFKASLALIPHFPFKKKIFTAGKEPDLK
jgi:hypothetical protein